MYNNRHMYTCFTHNATEPWRTCACIISVVKIRARSAMSARVWRARIVVGACVLTCKIYKVGWRLLLFLSKVLELCCKD